MLRVLVVDDDNGARLAMQDFLAEEGYQVDVAADGRDALASIETTPPGLLLTDLEMPWVGGEELISRVRGAHPNLPIVVLTSRLVVDAQREAQRLGVQGYLNKPIDLDALLDAITRALPAD